MYDYSAVPNKAKEFYDYRNVKAPLSPLEDEIARLKDELKAKEKKKKKDAKKAGKKKKKKLSDREEFLKEKKAHGPSSQVQKIQEIIEDHTLNIGNKKEMSNFEQKHDEKDCQDLVLPEVIQQMQVVVDEIIDMELANLRIRYKLKKKKSKKKKKHKKKKGKAKRVPGAKLCKNRDPRDMLAELVEAGIVKKLAPAHMNDLLGYPNLIRYEQEQQFELQPDPSMFDVRNWLVENVGLHLGSQQVKEQLKRQNFFYFFGPHGSGKTLSVRALASQTDSMIIDISPSTIGERYSDKNGRAKMLYMAFTCAKKYQPAIIYIDQVERIFKAKKKKKKGAAETGPKFGKLKGPLLKFKKAKYLKKEDKVAVISCTNSPWMVSAKVMKKFAEKKCYFPYPNYGTRKLIFEQLVLQKNVQIPVNFTLSTIAHITEGYTGGNIQEAISKVLTDRRILYIKERNITLQEFIRPLANQPSTYSYEYQKFRETFDDMSGVKARRKKKLNPEDDGDVKKKKTTKKKKK